MKAALRREFTAAERIPYRAHVAPTVVRTQFGDYVQALRLGGASFETRDDAELNNWHARLNVLWRNIASPGVALWSHLIRRSVSSRRDGRVSRRRERGNVFAESLHARYRRRLERRDAHAQRAVPRGAVSAGGGSRHGPFGAGPCASAARGVASRARGRARCLREACADAACLAGRYEPELLGCYRIGGVWCSSLLEYFALLINGERQRMPLPRGPLNEALASTRLFFGTEAIEYRTPTETRVGAMLGIKEYPTPTVVGMYDRLLSAPLSFVLTQSFAFLTKSTGQGLLQRQFNRMANAGDFAVSQAAELKDALDALTSNEFVMGDHHFSLQVMVGLARYRPRRVAEPGRPAQSAQRSGRARAQPARRHRHAGRTRGSGAGGRLLGAAARQLSVPAAQVADHVAKLRGHGALSQLSGWAGRTAITGARH